MPSKKQSRAQRNKQVAASRMLRETTDKQAQSARSKGVPAESFEDFLASIVGQPDESDVAVFNRGKDMHAASLMDKTRTGKAYHMQRATGSSNPYIKNQYSVNQGPPTPQYMQNSRGPTSDVLLQNAAMDLTIGNEANISPQRYQDAARGLLGGSSRPVEAAVYKSGPSDATFNRGAADSINGGNIQMSQATSTANIDALRAALEAAIADRDAKMSGRQGGRAQMFERARERYYGYGTKNR